MAGTNPGIISRQHIARLQRMRRKFLHGVGHGQRCGANERRRAPTALCQQMTVCVGDHGSEVVSLAHNSRKGGTHQSGNDFVGDRDQPIPHDAKGDGVH